MPVPNDGPLWGLGPGTVIPNLEKKQLKGCDASMLSSRHAMVSIWHLWASAFIEICMPQIKKYLLPFFSRVNLLPGNVCPQLGVWFIKHQVCPQRIRHTWRVVVKSPLSSCSLTRGSHGSTEQDNVERIVKLEGETCRWFLFCKCCQNSNTSQQFRLQPSSGKHLDTLPTH